MNPANRIDSSDPRMGDPAFHEEVHQEDLLSLEPLEELGALRDKLRASLAPGDHPGPTMTSYERHVRERLLGELEATILKLEQASKLRSRQPEP